MAAIFKFCFFDHGPVIFALIPTKSSETDSSHRDGHFCDISKFVYTNILACRGEILLFPFFALTCDSVKPVFSHEKSSIAYNYFTYLNELSFKNVRST